MTLTAYQTLRDVEAALTDEDEIAHGEAWDDDRKRGRGFCAYCAGDWPCHTQQGIFRLLIKVRAALRDEHFDDGPEFGSFVGGAT